MTESVLESHRTRASTLELSKVQIGLETYRRYEERTNSQIDTVVGLQALRGGGADRTRARARGEPALATASSTHAGSIEDSTRGVLSSGWRLVSGLSRGAIAECSGGTERDLCSSTLERSIRTRIIGYLKRTVRCERRKCTSIPVSWEQDSAKTALGGLFSRHVEDPCPVLSSRPRQGISCFDSSLAARVKE